MVSATAKTALNKALSRNVVNRRQAVLDRLFALWFARFVYNQIWEDPSVDLQALQLRPESRIVAIASGGCNILNYLAAGPRSIVAVDLNPAHIALTRLKLAAMRELPNHESFFQFFGIARDRDNIELYHSSIAPTLDAETRKFWEHKSLLGRQRIDFFAKGLYRKALLGRFIGFLHGVAKLAGQDPSRLLDARSREEQLEIYSREIEPLFGMKLVRLLCRQPILLYSLGIPPNQFDSMREDSRGDLAQLYQERIRRLACDFDLSENYFAWQAFGRHYDVRHRRATPPYLQLENFHTIRDRLGRVETHCVSMTGYLAAAPPRSHDRYVLLDSVDWMDEQLLGDLWQQIRRTSRPGARVIFRTAGSRSVLETLLPQEAIAGWRYEEETSRALLARDRSAIYGGFHLYVRH